LKSPISGVDHEGKKADFFAGMSYDKKKDQWVFTITALFHGDLMLKMDDRWIKILEIPMDDKFMNSKQSDTGSADGFKFKGMSKAAEEAKKKLEKITEK